MEKRSTSMNKYEVLGVVGEGAYGVVLKCRNKNSKEVVAIKKFKESEDDAVVRKTTLREVKILRMLKHFNIVLLKEAFRRKGKLYLVFEYADRNLLEVLEENPSGLSPELVRMYIFQLVRAINWCHNNGVIHRDIKPENLLINADHSLNLCDFGFARTVARPGRDDLTDYVATRWYRAPELLLGDTKYDMTVDIWAIGCIMGELIDGQPLFPGESEIDQLYVIQKVIGPLTRSQHELFLLNPRFLGLKFPDMSRPETLQQKYMGKISKRGLDIMRKMIKMDHRERQNASQLMENKFFDGLHEGYEEKDRAFEKRYNIKTTQARKEHRPPSRPPSRATSGRIPTRDGKRGRDRDGDAPASRSSMRSRGRDRDRSRDRGRDRERERDRDRDRDRAEREREREKEREKRERAERDRERKERERERIEKEREKEMERERERERERQEIEREQAEELERRKRAQKILAEQEVRQKERKRERALRYDEEKASDEAPSYGVQSPMVRGDSRSSRGGSKHSSKKVHLSKAERKAQRQRERAERNKGYSRNPSKGSTNLGFGMGVGVGYNVSMKAPGFAPNYGQNKRRNRNRGEEEVSRPMRNARFGNEEDTASVSGSVYGQKRPRKKNKGYGSYAYGNKQVARKRDREREKERRRQEREQERQRERERLREQREKERQEREREREMERQRELQLQAGRFPSLAGGGGDDLLDSSSQQDDPGFVGSAFYVPPIPDFGRKGGRNSKK